MLLMNTTAWIVIGVAVVILALVIGARIKDRYF
jgi:multisubunit Na+/H+ antiporter MnhC subunit